MSETGNGLTRREILKKGALLGGAIAWTTPIVQTIGMSPALAQTASPTCDVTICVSVTGVGHLILQADDPDCFCCCAAKLAQFCGDCASPGPPLSPTDCQYTGGFTTVSGPHPGPCPT